MAVALLYALLGGLLGLGWLAFPERLPGLALRAHAHLMLVGFAGMMIFGIALQVLPRFTGGALYFERLADARFVGAPIRGGWAAWLQQGLVHAGAVAVVTGFVLGSRGVALAGGVLAWFGRAIFASRLWPVMFANRVGGAG